MHELGGHGAAAAGFSRRRVGAGEGSAPVVSLQQAFVSVIKQMLPSVVEIRTAAAWGPGWCSTPLVTS